MRQVARSLSKRSSQTGLSHVGTGTGAPRCSQRYGSLAECSHVGYSSAQATGQSVPKSRDYEASKGDQRQVGWPVSGRHDTGIIHSPERLHFWGFLTALTSKSVHILGSRSHHLVGLQLALVLRAIHL